jgi:hypothetical protein
MVVGDPLSRLAELRENEAAGSDIATRRLLAAKQGSITPRVKTGTVATAQQIVAADDCPPMGHDESVPQASESVSPADAIKMLRGIGYVARQNQRDVSLYLNLGGSQSEVDKAGFKGLLLLNPSRNLVFGACAPEITEFRSLVMQRTADGDWCRLPEVPGPSGDQRVEVAFVYSDEDEPRICCRTTSGEKIWIDGLAEELMCDPHDGYRWADINRFRSKLASFCSQPIDHTVDDFEKK